MFLTVFRTVRIIYYYRSIIVNISKNNKMSCCSKIPLGHGTNHRRRLRKVIHPRGCPLSADRGGLYVLRDLNRLPQANGVQVTLPHERKEQMLSHLLFSFVRKMGLEPTQRCRHKILSLARLPIPTLPRSYILSKRTRFATKAIIPQLNPSVNT